ncbi:MAG: hypothetical protein HY556_09360 [Euryarchaeota archaeon]|nr:hypothetical protein [Euryarchaeota archaeon]
MFNELEENLRIPVAAHYARLGWKVAHEVEINGRYADLVFGRAATILAVELKLTDWREALAQASHYQTAAHESYVAMPLENTFAPMRQRGKWERAGVGLLGVDMEGGVRVVKPSRASERRLPFLTEHLLEKHFKLDQKR